jgi:hypothetical protein
MKKILRQTALGVGTFGTGCALLALSVNPYLLVLTDAVVGVGMLFAAGSVSMNDLHPKKGGGAGAGAAAAESISGGADEVPAGLTASLGKLKSSLKPPGQPKGKEEKETRVKEIDTMLDATLAGQSKRLISLAEGGASPGPAAKPAPASPAGPAARGAAAGTGGNLLYELSQAPIAIPFGDEEEPAEEAAASPGGVTAPAPAGLREAGTAPLPGLGEIGDAVARARAAPEPEDIGADDLLSALRAEAMKEKKRDDTSLVRDLQGVKVTGRQLLDELDSLVRDIRGR